MIKDDGIYLKAQGADMNWLLPFYLFSVHFSFTVLALSTPSLLCQSFY